MKVRRNRQLRKLIALIPVPWLHEKSQQLIKAKANKKCIKGNSLKIASSAPFFSVDERRGTRGRNTLDRKEALSEIL